MSEHSSSVSRPASPVGALPDFHSARPYRFQWDPSTRRPGPGSVSETTEGRGGEYFAAKPPLSIGILNTASLATLPLGALPSEWSSSKQGFHAISTVLNNPHKRQAPPKAHSALPTITPAELPRVKRKDFDPYLRAVAPEWERFENNNKLGRDGAPQLDDAATPRASSVDLTPRLLTGRALPPLDSVPSVFFDVNFNLGDSRTFNAVTEQGEEEASDPSALAHSLPLLEKLSHYADTIEQHLVREISLRSTSFFAALTNLQDLQTESEQCLDRITKLRSLLRDLDDKGAKRGLEIVRRGAKLRNIGRVKEGIKMVGDVVEMGGVARDLVTAGQWGEGLDVVEEMGALWTNDQPSASLSTHKRAKSKALPSLPSDDRVPSLPIPDHSSSERPTASTAANFSLASLHAFASLPEHLRTLTIEIASSLTSEAVDVLRVDLAERIETKSQHSRQQMLKDRLRPLLHGLVRTKGLRDTTVKWREAVMIEIRDVIKRYLPFDLPDDDPKGTPRKDAQRSTGLANHLRNLSHVEFMDLLGGIYSRLLNCVEGLQIQGGVVVEVLGSIQSDGTPVETPTLQEDLSDILSSAAEFANTRMAKVITFRTEQHAALELADFLVFFNRSWQFVVRCEVICQRMIVGLRGIVVSQAKVFLQAFHQARISNSAKLVEDEQWNPAEVSPSLQRITDTLIDSAMRDPPDLLIDTSPSPAPAIPALSPPSVPALRSQSNGSATSSSKHLRIEDRVYFTVSATAEVLVLLLDYLKVIVNLSMLTTDTMSRVIEFLKAFNSRTCQVVLGAGAMRSAGLKNITAKHLALASQSLSIMIALIPYVRETFRRHLSQKQAVMLVEFDKLKRDYQEHQNEIHSKLIAIMGDRLSAHIKSLQVVKWDVASKPAGAVNDYMELLVKETVTLHKVLSRYLSVPVVEYVMTQVFAAINHRLSEEYTSIELPNLEAKERLLADARFLHQKLSALKNVGAPSNMLETIISEKRVTTKSPPLNVTPGSSANQRLKGIFKDNAKAVASLPKVDPSLTSLSSTHVTPSSTPPISGPVTNGINGGSESVLSLPRSDGIRGEDDGLGFEQVETMPEADSERPLPAPLSSPLPASPRPESKEDGSMLSTSKRDDGNIIGGQAAEADSPRDFSSASLANGS